MNNSSSASTSTAPPTPPQPNTVMATDTGTTRTQPEQIPLIGLNESGNSNAGTDNFRAPDAAHTIHQDPNVDIEDDAAHGPGPDGEALPEYKEEDMAEPLPPYMARVRRVVQGHEPMATIMPDKRTGGVIVGGFVLIVLIIIGVSVGVTISSNKNGNNGNNNGQ